MRNWSVLVRERLDNLHLTPSQQDEVVAELASHLEEIYEERRGQGLGESAAMEHALDEVADWRGLSKKIRRAKQEENMNDRTRTLWLPGLASLTVANLFLMVLTRMTMQVDMLSRMSPRLALVLYAVWLIAQPAFGATGAYLSLRAGGRRQARIAAGLFPSLIMLGLMSAIPIAAFRDRESVIFHHPGIFALGVFAFAILPGASLFLGALPFLKGQKLRES